MSIPPKYDDLGKEARDVFGKGYGKSSLTFLLPCFSVQININLQKTRTVFSNRVNTTIRKYSSSFHLSGSLVSSGFRSFLSQICLWQ